MKNIKPDIFNNKNTLWIHSTNKKNKKGVIFYIHGFGSTFYMHNEFAFNNNFTDYDYYAVNLLGHEIGKTYDGDDDHNYYEINTYVDQIVNEIIKNNFFDVILIGHSMGGGICMLVYMRIASRIKKIILVNAINPSIYRSTIGIKYLYNVLNNQQNQIKELEVNPNRINPSDDVKFEINEFLDYELKRFLIKKNKYLLLGAKLISPVLYTKLNKAYKYVTIPVLFLSGENDPVIPSKSTKKYFELVNNPYIKFEVVANTKHILFIESFEDYNNKVWSFINDEGDKINK